MIVTMNHINPRPDNLIWIDLEMTGLNTAKDHIIEIATIVTDSQLNILEEGPVLAIYQTDEVLASMDRWNVCQHNDTGLIERVRASIVTETEAEAMTLEFLMRYVPPGKSPMCGNSICQDRRFLFRWMPALEQYFHYRHIDVSTIKELSSRWTPQIALNFKKKSKHIALEDIKDSISELKYYREHFFKI